VSEAAAALDPEEALLWQSLKSDGSSSAREQLFVRHAAFARTIAAKLHRTESRGDIEIDDMRQLAYAGLLEALDRFEPARAIPFRAYALHRITGSIRDGLSRMSEVREQITWRHRMRRERAQSLSEAAVPSAGSMDDAMAQLAEIAVGLALGFMLEGSGLLEASDEGSSESRSQPTGYNTTLWNQMLRDLRSELDRLPGQQQVVLRTHYIDGVGFDQIAHLLGVTKGRVSQLHRAALALLRKRMDKRGHFHLER
jgi:RNA polymerase sigma factor for flagellar operon FliA